MSLSWAPVADDGGRDVTQYIVEKREPGKRAWAQVDMCDDLKCTSKNLTVSQLVSVFADTLEKRLCVYHCEIM